MSLNRFLVLAVINIFCKENKNLLKLKVKKKIHLLCHDNYRY